jgi:hypothetical protein
MIWPEEEAKIRHRMLSSLNDQDPGRPKAVTNADEQDVAVNHSTKEQGGYDEPTSSQESAPVATNNENPVAEEQSKEKKSEKGPSSQTNKNF